MGRAEGRQHRTRAMSKSHDEGIDDARGVCSLGGLRIIVVTEGWHQADLDRLQSSAGEGGRGRWRGRWCVGAWDLRMGPVHARVVDVGHEAAHEGRGEELCQFSK